jgi:putative transposase
VTRPRMRSADGAGELPVASYELFSSTEILWSAPHISDM